MAGSLLGGERGRGGHRRGRLAEFLGHDLEDLGDHPGPVDPLGVHAVVRRAAPRFLKQSVLDEAGQVTLDGGLAAEPLEIGVTGEGAAPAPEHLQHLIGELHVEVFLLACWRLGQVIELLAQTEAFHHEQCALPGHQGQDGRQGGFVQQQVRVELVVRHRLRTSGQVRPHAVLQGAQRFRLTPGQHEAPAVAAVAFDQAFLAQVPGDGGQRVVPSAEGGVDLLPQLREGKGGVGRVVQHREDQLTVCGAAVLLGCSHAAHRRGNPVES